MKEDNLSITRFSPDHFSRQVAQEKHNDKHDRHSGENKTTTNAEGFFNQTHQEKRAKYQYPAKKIDNNLRRESRGDKTLKCNQSPPVDPSRRSSRGAQAFNIADDKCPTSGEKTPLVDELEATKAIEDLLRTRRLSAAKQNIQSDTNTAPVVSKQPIKDDEVNLSFCGCGFLGIYHVGVASCFHEYAPQLSLHKISGSSAGALVAMAHICGNLQLAYCTTDFLAVAIEARSHALGPFHPSFDIQATVREALERGLPEDAYMKANGKLHVSLTRVEDGENVIISEFKSNEDLIQVLLCSCFIPFWSGIRLPKYKGVAYIDGGFSNNLLILDDKTVTVSPFAGEADICPQDDTLNLLQINLSNTSFSLSPSNLYRLSHALLPPEPEVLSDLCKQGFADGIRFLQRMNLISCTKCLEIRSSLLVTTGGEDMGEVLSMNSPCPEQSDCNKSVASDTASLHHIVLEQQEQKMIEISGRSRRNSFISTKSQIYPHQQHPAHNTTSISLRNLLDGKSEDIEPTHCNDCNLIRQKALYDPLPKQLGDRIRESCDKVNKSLSNWIYSHRPVKYLSYLMVPYYLPIDLTLALVYKCWKKMPFIRAEISGNVCYMLDMVIVFLKRMQSRSTSAMLMGYETSWEEDIIAYEKELIRKQQETTQVHHHHHHHHHHHNSNISLANSSTSSTGVGGLGACPSTAGDTTSLSSRHRGGSNLSLASGSLQLPAVSHSRELHSLEDTFDSIVDVTSEQEGRIFAYYFRDSKDRLRVTEIFDLDHVHQPPVSTAASTNLTVANKQPSIQVSMPKP